MLQPRPLIGKFRLQSTLVVKTGLHIGGGGENLDIGGLDKPVVRDPLTQYPYLPGSSIKGKLRSILERFYNKPLNLAGSRDTYRYESDDWVDGYSQVDSGDPIAYQGARICPISRLFGSTGGANFWVESNLRRQEDLEVVESQGRVVTREIDGVEYTQIKRGRNHPARLIIRDCHLQEESAKKLQRVDTRLYMTEWKFENGIDRVTAAANPRQIERVPADSRFEFELVYTVEDVQQGVEDLQNIAVALSILEDDALGGHGSRGYGKVEFCNFRCFWRDLSQYRRVTTDEAINFRLPFLEFEDTAALLAGFGQLSRQIQGELPE
ncbi:type III-A CRISPR-associated RAMP protein Csm3 [Coleofasciculus sp.]|uniref:type III-A CRISPR-associated RAMP protein Csm3 n=1 Tax=Coleofasciculus sp. TaxID=3100458 RepID=UPI003A3D780E